MSPEQTGRRMRANGRSWLRFLAGVILAGLGAGVCLPAGLPVTDLSRWQLVRRGSAEVDRRQVLALRDQVAVWRADTFTDFTLRVRARMQTDGEIWLRFRYVDERTHYAVALRANGCDDLILFKFQPGRDGRLFQRVRLGFHPVPARWYDLTVRVQGKLIEVWAGDNPYPRLRLIDPAPIPAGRVALGGGPFPVDYWAVAVEPLPTALLEDDQPSAAAIRINFQPGTTPLAPGYQPADGSVYRADRGFGWTQDMQSEMRRRNIEADPRLDTLAVVGHGREQAAFLLDCLDGDYILSLAGGDASSDSYFQVSVGDEPAPSENLDIPAGCHYVLRRPVTVTGGRLTLTFRSNNPYGQDCGAYNWFALEPRASAPDKFDLLTTWWAEAEAARLALLAENTAAAAAWAERRHSRWTAYQPVVPPETGPGERVTADLGGNWLVLPDSERAPDERPYDPAADESRWGVTSVPAFVRPVRWWEYDSRKGYSDKLADLEQARVAELPFDPLRTDAVWYRQWFFCPANYAIKTVRLKFHGLAMAGEVWLNGTHLGGHAGMFAPFELDATPAILPGTFNCLTVLACAGTYRGKGDLDRLLGPEAAARLTRDILDALPRGIYGSNFGLWQPVEMIATNALHIAQAQVTPSVDGLAAEIHIANTNWIPITCRLESSITGREDGRPVFTRTSTPVMVGSRKELVLPINVSGLDVRAWSPGEPNLYNFSMTVYDQESEEVLDRLTMPVGFRTFEVRENRFYLNGQPYWLRGANPCPSGLRPADDRLAHEFLRRMREGNTLITRTHGAPFSETWLRAADEEGIGVNLEGIWPYVLGASLVWQNQTVPPPELVEAWRTEWMDVIGACRNHPCILMWVLSNESYWSLDPDPAQRARKWQIADELIRATRSADPSRPVVADSGYVRDAVTYPAEVAANSFDDGDVDDSHFYFGWYEPSSFTTCGRYIEDRFIGSRPAVSQETCTGYPDSDSGHPARKGLVNYIPQVWGGNWAYPDRDPSLLLDRHAFITKELAEMLRRDRQKLSGVLLFANCTWWRDGYDPDRLAPYPVYEATRTAFQPVLVSLDLRNRHYFNGDRISGRLSIVHDDPRRGPLQNPRARVWLEDPAGAVLAETAVSFGEVPYYGCGWADFSLPVPEQLPWDKAACTLRLELAAPPEIVSRNAYPLVLARREWAAPPAAGGIWIIAGEEAAREVDRAGLMSWLGTGGSVLLLNAGAALPELLPETVSGYTAQSAEIAGMEVPEHPLFDGLDPADLAWFNAEPGGFPVAAAGGYTLAAGASATVLATVVRPHYFLGDPGQADFRQYIECTAFEQRIGGGTLLAADLPAAAIHSDPLAARLYRNMVRYLAGCSPGP